MKPYKIIILCLALVCLALGSFVFAVLMAVPGDSSLSTTAGDIDQVAGGPDRIAERERKIASTANLPVLSHVSSGRRKLDFEDDWCRPMQLNPAAHARYQFELENWRKTIGYFSNEDRLAYTTYEDDALWQLGNEGDLLALDTLFERLIRTRKTAPGAHDALYAAAAFGSTKAAITLATVHRLKMRRKPDGWPVDEDLYRVMAYYEIAASGGDLYGVRKGRNFLRGMKRELSDVERAIVADLAIEIREDLRRQRRMSARPPARTELPKAAVRYREYQHEKYFSDPEYVGWGSDYIDREGECKDADEPAIDGGSIGNESFSRPRTLLTGDDMHERGPAPLAT